MTNLEIQEEFGFIIEDGEFRDNYMHLLEKEWLGKYLEIMGKPEDYPDLPRYYEILSFALLGMQITNTLQDNTAIE